MKALKKYKKGGKVNSLKNPPTDPPKVQPTESDSLFLLETNKVMESLMNLNYEPSMTRDIDPNNWDTEYKYYLDEGLEALEQDLKVRDRDNPKEDYLEERDGFTGLTDWLAGGDDDYFMPKSYIHPDIAPQYFSDFNPDSLTEEEEEEARNAMGLKPNQPLPDIATFRYANLAITPTKYLTPKERQDRIDKYGDVNVGDINAPTEPMPISVLKRIANSVYSKDPAPAAQAEPPVQEKPAVTPNPKIPVPDKMTPKSAPTNSYSNRSIVPSKQTSPKPAPKSDGDKKRTQPIMRMDKSKGNRFGQYQIGERFWDDSRKQWVDRMWDKEDQKASRELAKEKTKSAKKQKPKRKKTYVTFKDGGKITKSSSSEWYAKNGTKKKDAYNKEYHSTSERKEYRALLNNKNREMGTYGNGDKKDVSHKKNGGFELENQSYNRARNRGKK